MGLVISVSRVIINHTSLVEMGYFQGISSYSKIDQVWENVSVVIEILLSKFIVQNYISRPTSVNMLPTADSSYQRIIVPRLSVTQNNHYKLLQKV